MLFYLALFVLGLLLVLKGGDLFVDSSITIANRFKIPRIVIGGTIVSLATTAPELVVSTTASYMGNAGIALGNAVGSAIANIGLIVGVAAILAPIAIDVVDFRRRSLWMLLSAILVVLFSWDFDLGRGSGLMLFALSVLYLLLNYLQSTRKQKNKELTPEITSAENDASFSKAILRFLIGAVLVIVGSKLLVNAGIAIATALKIPSLIIGLTAIAVGTSLPELVTAITSAKKKVADLAIGNIVGANILNLAFITGVSAMIRPLSIELFTRNYAFVWLFIMIIAMMIIFWKKGTMGKKSGILLVSLYVIYNLGLVLFSVLGYANK
ncbi:MAG: calcium/sodium antiporter [Legionella sp.]|uniref:calcium/sodium antiporter n=1 Tax=Legionella sp. TaxID=459 RepID=UPI002848B34A|nr:calcium/sodium antiporter [Legionella sp.]